MLMVGFDFCAIYEGVLFCLLAVEEVFEVSSCVCSRKGVGDRKVFVFWNVSSDLDSKEGRRVPNEGQWRVTYYVSAARARVAGERHAWRRRSIHIDM